MFWLMTFGKTKNLLRKLASSMFLWIIYLKILIKKGCYLINTSRGGVCDTAALLKGIKQGIFAGLGLDVLEGECFIKEERELLTLSFKENIKSFRGKPINLVKA